MADLNQRYLTYVQTLRNTNASGQPTQTLDSTRSVTQDIPTQRALDANFTDLNAMYLKVLP